VVTVVVVSHGNLAGALLSTAEMIAGECPNASALELGPDESPEAFRRRLLAALTGGENGRPGEWLILTDLLGGTPHRVAATVRDDVPDPKLCAVVSGVNLAMVVEALLSCEGEMDAESLALHVASTGLQQVRGSVPAL
jgi:mannose/fructose-specific phosphotransferase system component IIA